MRFAAFHPPELATVPERRSLPFGSHRGEAPVLRAADLERALAAADRAAEALRSRPHRQTLDSLAAVAELWADPEGSAMSEARTVLPDGTGYSEPVVRRGLGAMIDALRGDHVRHLLESELGRGSRPAPKRLTHVLSGNIPGISFAPIFLSLALEFPVLVKNAAGDPYSSAAMAASIARIDPDLARCLVVHDWRGGDVEMEDIAFAADVVVAFGSDAAIRAIAPRVRGRFFGHGHKISFAVVARDALASAAVIADRLAFDVALWDQQGCLSPQLCFVERGGSATVDEFADAVSVALDGISPSLPPRRLGLAEQAAIATFRHECEWQPGTSRDRLLRASGTEWTLSVEHLARFRATCLNRCLRIVAVDDFAQLPELLYPHRPHLEAAGIASTPPRGTELAAMLRDRGVHRVCAIGEMQTPDLTWQQGGGPRVRHWVEPAAREE